MFTEFTEKKVFGQLILAVAPPARCSHGRQKVHHYSAACKSAVNLKSASFVVNMLLYKGLTHSIASKASVAFWGEFHFNLHGPKKSLSVQMTRYYYVPNCIFIGILVLMSCAFVFLVVVFANHSSPLKQDNHNWLLLLQCTKAC